MLSFILLPQHMENNLRRQIAHRITRAAFIWLPLNLSEILEPYVLFPVFSNIICQLDASNRNQINKDMLDFSVQQLFCQRDRRGPLVSELRNLVRQSTFFFFFFSHRKQESFNFPFANESILNRKYLFSQQSCGGLPGRTWRRCSSATHG